MLLWSLYLTSLLLIAAVCPQNDLDPGPKVKDIAAVPVSFPDDDTAPSSRPSSPSPPPLPLPPSPPTTTKPLPSSPIDNRASSTFANGGDRGSEISSSVSSSSKGEQSPLGPEFVVSSESIGPSSAAGSSESSCSFTVGGAESIDPQAESFGYPESVIEQAVRGTLAEKALLALQEAQLRAAYTATITDTTNNNNGDILGGRNNNPLLPRIRSPQNSLGINGGGASSSLRPLPAVLNRNPVNGISLQKTLSDGLALGGSSVPGNPQIISGNVGGDDGNNGGPALDGLLRNLDPADSGRNNDGNAFSLNQPTNRPFNQNGQPFNNQNGQPFNNQNGQPFNNQDGQPFNQNGQPFNQNIDQLFASGGGDNQRFPQDSFFGPQRFANKQEPNRAASSPFGFYGLQGLRPLSGIKTGNGGNDIIYDVKGGGGGEQPTPFDGLNPFQIDSQFPAPRRAKRQTKVARGAVSRVCESRPRLLRQYRHHGGLCYVIRPQLQQISYVTCSQAKCSKCQYPEGATRCLADTRGTAVWAYCESGPFSQDVGLDFVHLPVVCSCKTMVCS